MNGGHRGGASMSLFTCPHCKASHDGRIIDSRDGDGFVRRRRECLGCRRRYTTYEHPVEVIARVTKRDGGVEPYNRVKLAASLQKAATPAEVIARVVGLVEDAGQLSETLTTMTIAEIAADALRRGAPVAYLRYISANRHFTDVRQFLVEAHQLVMARRR